MILTKLRVFLTVTTQNPPAASPGYLMKMVFLRLLAPMSVTTFVTTLQTPYLDTIHHRQIFWLWKESKKLIVQVAFDMYSDTLISFRLCSRPPMLIQP